LPHIRQALLTPVIQRPLVYVPKIGPYTLPSIGRLIKLSLVISQAPLERGGRKTSLVSVCRLEATVAIGVPSLTLVVSSGV